MEKISTNLVLTFVVLTMFFFAVSNYPGNEDKKILGYTTFISVVGLVLSIIMWIWST